MKLKLIEPGKLPFYNIGERYPLWYPSMMLPSVAAVTPGDWQLEIVESSAVDSIDFDEDVDLVGISVFTVHSKKAYKLSDEYRNKGVKTILGGVHCTALPDESIKHADAVVIGEVENIWQEVLTDFKEGNLKKFYRSRVPPDLLNLPLPRIDLLKNSNYANVNPVIPSRGCPLKCGFCLVPYFHGRTYRQQPVKRVLKEIEWIRENRGDNTAINFPENILSDKAYATGIINAIKPLNLKFGAEGYLPHLQDETFLDVLKQGGCYSIYAETEMVSKKKDAALFEAYEAAARMIYDKGIALIMNFTLGYDDDDEEVFTETWNFIERHHMAMFAIQLLVPWPGTPLFDTLKSENRIIENDWSLYDNNHVVFKPKLMSVDKLQNGYFDIWRAIQQRRHKTASSSL